MRAIALASGGLGVCLEAGGEGLLKTRHLSSSGSRSSSRRSSSSPGRKSMTLKKRSLEEMATEGGSVSQGTREATTAAELTSRFALAALHVGAAHKTPQRKLEQIGYISAEQIASVVGESSLGSLCD